jgi:hypothetical protein
MEQHTVARDTKSGRFVSTKPQRPRCVKTGRYIKPK